MSIIFFLALETYTKKYLILSPLQMEKVFILSYILEVKIHRTLPRSGISHPTLHLYFLYHILHGLWEPWNPVDSTNIGVFPHLVSPLSVTPVVSWPYENQSRWF